MSGHAANRSPADIAKLSIAALGIVYGDIGTSPLYAMKEVFAATEPPVAGHVPLAVDVPNVLGILSLFFWALTLVIIVKYLTFVMRADNQGEGGTFALIALLKPKEAEKTLPGVILILLGLFGASLLSGEGI